MKVTAFCSNQEDFEQIFVIQGELSVLPSVHVGCAVQGKGNSQLCEPATRCVSGTLRWFEGNCHFDGTVKGLHKSLLFPLRIG